MFCPTCGTKFPDGAKFCPACGAPLRAPVAAPAPMAPASGATGQQRGSGGVVSRSILPRRSKVPAAQRRRGGLIAPFLAFASLLAAIVILGMVGIALGYNVPILSSVADMTVDSRAYCGYVRLRSVNSGTTDNVFDLDIGIDYDVKVDGDQGNAGIFGWKDGTSYYEVSSFTSAEGMKTRGMVFVPPTIRRGNPRGYCGYLLAYCVDKTVYANGYILHFVDSNQVDYTYIAHATSVRSSVPWDQEFHPFTGAMSLSGGLLEFLNPVSPKFDLTAAGQHPTIHGTWKKESNGRLVLSFSGVEFYLDYDPMLP